VERRTASKLLGGERSREPQKLACWKVQQIRSFIATDGFETGSSTKILQEKGLTGEQQWKRLIQTYQE